MFYNVMMFAAIGACILHPFFLAGVVKAVKKDTDTFPCSFGMSLCLLVILILLVYCINHA